MGLRLTALDGLARRRQTPRVRTVQQDVDGGEYHQGFRVWKKVKSVTRRKFQEGVADMEIKVGNGNQKV